MCVELSYLYGLKILATSVVFWRSCLNAQKYLVVAIHLDQTVLSHSNQARTLFQTEVLADT